MLLQFTVEMVYFLRNQNVILPHCFLMNLVQSFISGSKVVSVINGKAAPGASYTSYKKWIADTGEQPVNYSKYGDVITFFDNIGKYIVKDYRVLSSKKESADIITSVLHSVLEEYNLQNDEELMPGKLRDSFDNKELQSRMKNIREIALVSFRKYRLEFIERILQKVAIENNDVDRKVSLRAEANCWKCTNAECGQTYESVKRKCDSCSSKVSKNCKEDVRFVSNNGHITTKEFNFGKNATVNTSSLKMGEPVMVNPNSYVNLEIILEQLKCNLIGDRKWTILGSDGPPYNLASRIIENNPEKYYWLIMASGMGHLHMNQIKSLFKVLDKILLDVLAKDVLGFKSPKAYEFFVNAKDTHKAYQALLVLLEGTASEMCYLFLKNPDQRFPKTAQGFLDSCGDNENETFCLVYQIIFNYVLAVYVQKVGVRLNDWDLIDAGRMKFLPLFYAFNHPCYQEVEYRDLANRARYPECLSKVLARKELLQNIYFNHESSRR